MLNKPISGYTILHLLGKGGMADVYYAENNLHRPAAIKVLHQVLNDLPEVRSRFEHEARIIVKLDHPNIRKVYDVAEIEGRPAIVMEYLDGYTLSESMVHQSLRPSDLHRLYDQAVSGLQYAHQKGVVHRDIKPSNLFLTSSGDLKILDFGIAKVEEASTHTLTGQTLGTILYMSPEQVEDPKRVDYHTDIYSLGVTFYHLITGKPPYDLSTDSSFKIQLKIVKDDLDLSSLSMDWYTRLASCLKKEPISRYFPDVGPINELSHIPPSENSIINYGRGNVAEKIDLQGNDATIVLGGLQSSPPGYHRKDDKVSRHFLFRIITIILLVGLIVGVFILYIVTNKKENEIPEIATYSGYQYSVVRKGSSEPIPANSYILFNMTLTQKDSILQTTVTSGKPSVLKLMDDNINYGQLKQLVDLMGTLHKGDSLNFYYPIDSFDRVPPGFEKFTEPLVYHVGIVDVMDEARYTTYSDSIDAATRSQEAKISYDNNLENERNLSQFSDKELSSEYEYSKQLENGNLVVAIGGKRIEQPYAANGYREYEGGKWGILSPTRRLLFSINCDYISSYSLDELLEITKGYEHGLVSTDGELFLKPIYGYLERTRSNLIMYSLNSKYGIISVAGKTIFPTEYDEIEDYGKDGFFLVKNNVRKYVRSTGELILDVSEYECSGRIKGNHVIVCKKTDNEDDYSRWWTNCNFNSKCGLINLQKEIIVPFIYDYVCFLSPTIVLVNRGGTFESGRLEPSTISGGQWGTIDLNNPSRISFKSEEFIWDVDREKEWVE